MQTQSRHSLVGKALGSLIFSGMAAGFAVAFPSTPAVARDDVEQSVEQAANDPTASLMSFQLQNYFSPKLYNQTGSGNVIQFRAAVPFELGGQNNIARITAPYVTRSGSGKTGLSDIAIFNLVAFDRDWGRFGVGAVAVLPSGDRGLGAGKWAIGPAFGFAARNEKLLWGVFSQNLFTIAERFDGPDLNVSTFQPLLNISLGNGWSTGFSEMTFVYDWNQGEFTSLPLGIKFAKLKRFGKVPVQFQATYEHNFYDDGFGPKDTIGFTVKALMPRG